MDITLCLNKNCEKRDECYRAQAKPDVYQSYSFFENACNEKNEYKYIIPMREK